MRIEVNESMSGFHVTVHLETGAYVVESYPSESDALAHAEVIRKALAWRPTEAICFKCRPSAFGITTAPSEPAPTCAACGAPCTGGGWVEVKR